MVTICTAEREPILTRPGVPESIVSSARWLDARDDADVDAYVIMPDHLHMLVRIRGDARLEDLVGSLKRYTARVINAHLDRGGRLWQRAYHDRAVRCPDEYEEHLRYIWYNAVEAGLVKRAEDYPWCSVNGVGALGGNG